MRFKIKMNCDGILKTQKSACSVSRRTQENSMTIVFLTLHQMILSGD